MSLAPSQAHAYSCLTTDLTPSTACETGSFAFDTPGNIAIDDPFGITDWIALDTSNDGVDDAVADIILFTDGTSSGNWLISLPNGSVQNPWEVYDQLMITMQGGQGGDYVAYLLTPEFIGGSYSITGAADLNHARLWGHSTVVPVPAAIWLFCSGLLGLCAMARRRN